MKVLKVLLIKIEIGRLIRKNYKFIEFNIKNYKKLLSNLLYKNSRIAKKQKVIFLYIRKVRFFNKY